MMNPLSTRSTPECPGLEQPPEQRRTERLVEVACGVVQYRDRHDAAQRLDAVDSAGVGGPGFLDALVIHGMGSRRHRQIGGQPLALRPDT